MGNAPPDISRISQRTSTPIQANHIKFVIIALLVSLDFNSILCIDNFFSASAAALEFAAIVRLRIKSPELRRPYRIPLSTRGLILLLLIPTAWSLLICYVTLTDSIQSASTIGVGLLIGLVLYVPFMRGDRATLDFTRLSHQAALVDSTTHSGNTHSPLFGPLLDFTGSKRTPHGSACGASAHPAAEVVTDYVLEPAASEAMHSPRRHSS